MASVAGVVCFGSGAAKSQHFSRFHTFYGHMGADVGFLKAIYDFRQQISQKPLSISVSGRQKANIELIWARRGCLRRDLLAAGFVYSLTGACWHLLAPILSGCMDSGV